MLFISGGAGFIGANFVLHWLSASAEPVINLDRLTYAGNLENLASLKDDPRHIFVRGDIGDATLGGLPSYGGITVQSPPPAGVDWLYPSRRS